MIAECYTNTGEYVEERIYTWDTLPIHKYLGYGVSGNKKTEYWKLVTSFDIETTSIDCDNPYGFMYIWQFCIEEDVCMGRTWGEFANLLKRLKKTLLLDDHIKLVIWVHNLSFEFQFMSSFFEVTGLFAKEKRKVLRVELENSFEFRCSYYLTNKPLARFLKDTNVVHQKGLGDLDYGTIRTPSTKLTPRELGYCYNDVRGLVEAIKTKLLDDTLSSIPMTSTGYVRRNCRNAMRKNPRNRKVFQSLALNEEQYKLVMKLRRGGNTHAYRGIVDKTIHKVRNFDISSSYPYVMMCCYFPMSKFTKIKVKNMRQVRILLDCYACMFTVVLKGVCLKNHVPIPYIASAKCEHASGVVQFTGRILEAEYLEMSLTEIDFEIIEKQYNIEELTFREFYIADRGELPEELKEEIREYFQGKTELKFSDPYLYAKYKELLNAIFGMTMTDPIHEPHPWNDTEYWEAKPTGKDLEKTDLTLEEKLEEYYKGWNNFLTLQWSCWVTAHARKRLQDIIDITGMGTLYCDTDSDKCVILNNSILEKINKLNEDTIQVAEKYGAYANYNGEKVYMGVYEEEPSYLEFRTYGPKKYAYTLPNNRTVTLGICEQEQYEIKRKELHITIAGVNKELGARDLGKLENFKLGYIFGKNYDGVSSGGNSVWYNDCPVHEITVNGETFLNGSNIAVLPSTYTLGVTEEYLQLLDYNIDNIIYT